MKRFIVLCIFLALFSNFAMIAATASYYCCKSTTTAEVCLYPNRTPVGIGGIYTTCGDIPCTTQCSGSTDLTIFLANEVWLGDRESGVGYIHCELYFAEFQITNGGKGHVIIADSTDEYTDWEEYQRALYP